MSRINPNNNQTFKSWMAFLLNSCIYLSTETKAFNPGTIDLLVITETPLPTKTKPVIHNDPYRCRQWVEAK